MKFADVSKENLTGIYIPSELAANTTLSWNEKAVYSIYHYFTYYGQSHCCRLTNDTICERLGIKERSLQRIKNDLTNNGYITVNGITVKALKEFAGVTLLTPIANDEQRGDTFDTHSEQNTGVTLLTPIAVEQPRVTNMVEGVTKMVARGDTFDTHNKENKDNKEVTYLTSDSHQSDPVTLNNKITSDLELYVEDTPDVPEWMNELPVTEPFVQYTDDIQGEAMQETDNNTFQDEETDPDEPQENETSLNAALSDERGDGGTTTHRQGESLSSGEKTTSMGVTDPVTDNESNNFITDTHNMNVQERKEKQTELSRKWENFKEQVPQMHRADAEMYFKRFLTKVEQYYTGTHIAITQERFTREFNALKPLADWNEQAAKKDVEMWISQGFNPDTLKRYVRQKYGEAHDEFVMAQWKQHHSKPIELNPEYVKNPNAPYVLPF